MSKTLTEITTGLMDLIDECPRCHEKLTHQYGSKIKCQTCGFVIRTGSVLDDYFMYAVVAGMILLVIGLIAGIAWQSYLDHLPHITTQAVLGLIHR
jgi:uncharacterized protein (DUF983 family)